MHSCVYMDRLAVTVHVTGCQAAVSKVWMKCKLDDACSPCSVFSTTAALYVASFDVRSIILSAMKTKINPAESKKIHLHFFWLIT